MPSTIAIFIQAFPWRGGRGGGGGGVISGGGFAGMTGGGGAWPGSFDTSCSIEAGSYLMGLARASAIRPSAELPGESTGLAAPARYPESSNEPSTAEFRMNRAPLISRRSFLKTSTTAGAIVALSGLPYPRWLAAAPDARSPDWVDRPMRWAQLTLVEDDPGKFDLQFWLDYFK